MSGTLAAHWFRVARLTPNLRAHAQVHRHVARGQIWYVLQDHQTGRFFRISPAANLMLCLMDGRRTMEEIFRRVAQKLGPARPTQDETVRLMIQLHQADLLRTGLPPDMTELGRRADKFDAGKRLSWFTSPMAMRFPLADPDRFLTATLPFVRPIFTRTGFTAWLLLILCGLVLAILHWPEITANVSDRVFTTYNVLMLVLLYPASKALHEFGHAYMTKANGGEVHEVGIMLLVLFPVPYVDASASSAFPEPSRRILVGAAGMMVELALAALAMIAWVNLSPGLMRAASFNLMLLCSVSTLLFNGNPLLRFDGYYILGDLLQIHNLDQRSRRYLTYLIQRFGFGMRRVESPLRAPNEAKWLAGYGAVAFVYRITIMVGIGLVVSQRYFAIGVILAAVSVAQMLVLPVLRGVRFLISDPALRLNRQRALTVAGAAAGAVALLLLVIPIPYAEVVQGVVWVPDEAVVHAAADGFVAEILASPNNPVVPGQPVIALRDPVADTQVEVYRTQVTVAEDRFNAVNLIDLAQARLAAEQVTRAQAALERAESRARDLNVLAQRGGRFVVPDAARLPGSFVHKGDVLGYVIGGDDVAVLAVVPQAEIDLVRHRSEPQGEGPEGQSPEGQSPKSQSPKGKSPGGTSRVAIRFTEAMDQTVPAEIVRETPSALERPPAAALSTDGGGPMLLDPTSKNRDRPLDRWYEIVVRPTAGAPLDRIGSHAYVRFDLGAEPIAWRLLRHIRQVVLRTLDV
jgi:putative peptide zinc metalloprotease protein